MGIVEVVIKRVKQHCYQKFGSEPSSILLTDLFIEVFFWGSNSEYLREADLTDDLDVAYDKRKEDFYAKAKQQEIEAKQRAAKKREEEKEKRKAQYLELKKEFEQD